MSKSETKKSIALWDSFGEQPGVSVKPISFETEVKFERWEKGADLPGLSDAELDKLYNGKKN